MFRSALIFFTAFFMLVPVTEAEHEVDHRYNVSGYVLDADESPIIGSSVSIRLGDAVIGTSTTNSQGYYYIRLHLHDSDYSKRLQIRTATGEASVKVNFDPGDKSTARNHYVNFIDGKLVEKRLAWREFTGWLYSAAIVAAVVVAVVSFRRPLKRLLKSRRKLPANLKQTAASKKGKKRRKRRTT